MYCPPLSPLHFKIVKSILFSTLFKLFFIILHWTQDPAKPAVHLTLPSSMLLHMSHVMSAYMTSILQNVFEMSCAP